MTYTIERTDSEILIKLPIGSTPKQVQNMLNFLRYFELGQSNKITQTQVNQLANESKEKWWQENKDRFKGVDGFDKVVTFDEIKER